MRITILFLIIVGITACKKDTFDYRNKYVGGWDIKRIVVRQYPDGRHDTVRSEPGYSYDFNGRIDLVSDDYSIWVPIDNSDGVGRVKFVVTKEGGLSGFGAYEGGIKRKEFAFQTPDVIFGNDTNFKLQTFYEGSR
jgi:hypothetical protein